MLQQSQAGARLVVLSGDTSKLNAICKIAEQERLTFYLLQYEAELTTIDFPMTLSAPTRETRLSIIVIFTSPFSFSRMLPRSPTCLRRQHKYDVTPRQVKWRTINTTMALASITQAP